jgi:hypothetical protein
MKYLAFGLAVLTFVVLAGALWAVCDLYVYLTRPDAKNWP